ncbi:T9SS-dependent choice-of-anchor J family protein [Flavobacterium difficile]|uniref:T9SS type A sorting domain-containing protein n=1 Tax=Flavobacterium difficile TaxID=2709659 RepID=A0ABX0I835_9FLAO|nr:T9SS type A sorting domain-containing protein [Flavobacterium difficile]NHM01994.1 T9SS type A sorting domain-containing protein [Flavobacterium difficile]
MKKKLLTFGVLFSTLIGTSQTLLREDFEGSTFPPTGWTVENTHPNTLYNWSRSVGNPAATGNGSAIVNWVAATQDEKLISPSFSSVGLTNCYVNFTAIVGFEYMVTIPAGDLRCQVSTDNGVTWTTIWVEENEPTFTDYQPLYKNIQLGAPFLGQSNVKIRFQYEANDADLIRIDDISVTACPGVVGAKSSLITENTATLSWNSTASQFDLQYGPLGFALGSGTIVSGLTSPSANITGLTAGTAYSFYVKSKCGTTTENAWDGPYVFTTVTTQPTAPNYSYGFESLNLPQAGWSTFTAATAANTTSGFWGIAANVPAGFAVDGVNIALASSSTNTASNSWLFSRGITLAAGQQITINYSHRLNRAAGTTSVNNLALSIGTAANVASQTTTLTPSFSVTSTAAYVQNTATFTATTAGVYYLGFNHTCPQHTTAQRSSVLLDNVTVTSALSVDSFLTSNFNIYPNPVFDILKIENTNNLKINKIVISDINGRVIQENVSNFEAIDLTKINSGIYLLSLETENGNFTKKIVKE